MLEQAFVDRGDAFAVRLHKLVTEGMGIKIPWRRSKWANEFRMLVGEIGDRHEVERALTWFEANWREAKLRIFSASAFREKYDFIVDRMELAKEEEEYRRLLSDPDLSWVMDELDYVSVKWPDGVPANLPYKVARILQDARKMIPLLRDMEDDEVRQDEAYLARVFLEDLGDSPRQAAVWWTRWVANDVSSWKGWSGSFKGKEFNPYSPFFEKFIRHYAYGRVETIWVTNFIEVLQKAWDRA